MSGGPRIGGVGAVRSPATPSATVRRAGPRASSRGDFAVVRRDSGQVGALDDLAGPQQHRRGLALGAAHQVHAPVHAVGEVDVDAAGGPNITAVRGVRPR